MSADNGVYIAEFPTRDGGKEWRVAHCQNIEDCDIPEVGDAYLVTKFSRSKVYTDYSAAVTAAWSMYEEILAECVEDGMPPIVEYGVSELYRQDPFPTTTEEEADRQLEGFWARVSNESRAPEPD
jgi:hypothetical protein